MANIWIQLNNSGTTECYTLKEALKINPAATNAALRDAISFAVGETPGRESFNQGLLDLMSLLQKLKFIKSFVTIEQSDSDVVRSNAARYGAQKRRKPGRTSKDTNGLVWINETAHEEKWSDWIYNSDRNHWSRCRKNSEGINEFQYQTVRKGQAAHHSTSQIEDPQSHPMPKPLHQQQIPPALTPHPQPSLSEPISQSQTAQVSQSQSPPATRSAQLVISGTADSASNTQNPETRVSNIMALLNPDSSASKAVASQYTLQDLESSRVSPTVVDPFNNYSPHRNSVT